MQDMKGEKNNMEQQFDLQAGRDEYKKHLDIESEMFWVWVNEHPDDVDNKLSPDIEEFSL